MKKAIRAIVLSLSLILACNPLTAWAVADISESDLLGQWITSQLITDPATKIPVQQLFVVNLMEDGIGSYIDNQDPEIKASGMGVMVNWKMDSDKLILTYQNNPEKHVFFSVVINNGFVNLVSANQITIPKQASNNQAAKQVEASSAEKAQTTPENIHVKTGDKPVLMDEQGIKISLTGKYTDNSNVIELEAIIENNHELNIGIRQSAIANGWEASVAPLMGNNPVSSGAKAKRPIYIYKEDISAETYQELETLKLTFSIQDEYGNKLFDYRTGTVYFDDHTGIPENIPQKNICSPDELVGKWVEIHDQDTMTLFADGSGENSYIQYRSATSYSKHDQEAFTWNLAGSELLIEEGYSTFREKLGGKFNITRENDELVLAQGNLVYKKVRQPIKLKMGETAKTDMMTFSPSKYSYASRVSNIVQPTTGGIMFSPGDGLVWAIVHCQISSPNREKISGKQWSLSLDYKDGIVYSSSDSGMHYIEGGSYKLSQAPEFSSSSNLESRIAFKVAEKMKNDKSSPLKLIVQLPSKEYGYQIFEYDILR